MERILTQHAFKYKYKPLTQHLKEALKTIQTLFCLKIIPHAKDHARPHNTTPKHDIHHLSTNPRFPKKTPTQQPTPSITNRNINISPQPKEPNYILFKIIIYLLQIHIFEPTMNRIKTKPRLHSILTTTTPLRESHT